MNRGLIGLPALAVILVAGVLGIQVAAGGGDFEPLRSADPCAPRQVDSRAEGIDGLSERLVLLGVDGAACRLGTNREAFTLDIATASTVDDERIEALRGGLTDAVRRMEDDGTLPRASALANEAVEQMDLNPFLLAAIRAIPDAAIDAALKTDDVLIRAIADLDLRAVLADLDDQGALEERIQAEVTQAARESIEDRLRNLV